MAEWLQAGGAIVAAFVAFLALRSAKKSADAAGQSAVEARKATEAAERSAQAAERVAHLDEDRRADELAPDVSVEVDVEEEKGVRYEGFWVKLNGPRDAAAVMVSIDDEDHSPFLEGLKARDEYRTQGDSERRPAKSVQLGPMAVTDSRFVVCFPHLENDGPRQRILIRVEDGRGRSWTLREWIEWPWDEFDRHRNPGTYPR